MFELLVEGDLRYNEIISWVLVAFLPLVYLMVWPFVWVPWFIYCMYFIYNQFYNIEYVNANGKSVYITGCDSGFGLGLALALDERGFKVFAGCLNPHDAIELHARAQRSKRLVVLDLDVTNEEKVAKCAQVIRNQCGEDGLWALYNNAGYATAAEIEWVSMDEYQQQMNCNLWGTVRVTKSVLPLIRKAKGRVVTVTSGIARAVNPGRSGYSISKTALEAFVDCLRYEMAKFDVKCITINPGNLSGATKVFEGMAEKIDATYARMEEQIKKDYGIEYLTAFRNNLSGYKSTGAKVSVQPVIDDLVHAVTSKTPRIRYKPAQSGWFLWWFIYYLMPEQITDIYITQWYLRKLPKPASMQ